MITDQEHQTIQEFAAGLSYRGPLRALVEAIYQREVRTAGRFNLAMQFLSEVFSPVPDLYLRSRYRKALAAGEK
jgi:hypothetical protein